MSIDLKQANKKNSIITNANALSAIHNDKAGVNLYEVVIFLLFLGNNPPNHRTNNLFQMSWFIYFILKIKNKRFGKIMFKKRDIFFVIIINLTFGL